MRMTYLDEGGISGREPFFVVCGAIVHYDKQRAPILQELRRIAEAYIPEPDCDGFIFHAMNIFSGTGYFKNRDLWPEEKRILILIELLKIPSKFQIPIAMGFYERGALAKERTEAKLTEREVSLHGHAVAFSVCSMAVEEFMRGSFPSEHTMLIAENREGMREIINQSHSLHKNAKELKEKGFESELLPFEEYKRRSTSTPRLVPPAFSWQMCAPS